MNTNDKHDAGSAATVKPCDDHGPSVELSPHLHSRWRQTTFQLSRNTRDALAA